MEIEKFPYLNTDARNKPSLVEKKSKKIKGSALQVRTLIRFFPMIINKYIKNPASET